MPVSKALVLLASSLPLLLWSISKRNNVAVPPFRQRLQITDWQNYSSRPCPRTFVYTNLPAPFVDFYPERSRSKSGQTRRAGTLEENGNLAEVVLERLLNSPRCLTANATEAELFFVPILPKAKSAKEWTESCAKIREIGLVESLNHLTPENAHRHFFVRGRVAYHKQCSGWWVAPFTHQLMSMFVRVAIGGYEQFYGEFVRAEKQKSEIQYITAMPRLVSAPYVSNVRWSPHLSPHKEAEIAFSSSRSYLFSYAATPHGPPRATQLRSALQIACEIASGQCIGGTSPCPAGAKIASRSSRATSFHCPEPPPSDRQKAAESKLNSTFCVEPPGTTPGRQSIVNALLLGCIPVIFSREQDELWPLHWGGWRSDSRVLLPAEPFIKNPGALLGALKAIPPERIRHMQLTIKSHARSMQYATGDMAGDAFETLLHGILRAAG